MQTSRTAGPAAAAARPGRAALDRAARLAAPVLSPRPTDLRRLSLAGVVAAAGIMMTGAAVRLSQSGLGCPDWPACTAKSIVAGGASGDPLVHRWVEFGNRLVTIAIFAVAIAVFVAAWRFRDDRGRPRADLTWLAAAQPAAIIAQAVLGGIVVLTHLNPAWVSVHFMVSVAMVAATVALYVRCQEGTGAPRPLVRRELRLVAAGLLAVLFVMMAAGTVVTGTGPLAGAANVARYHLPLNGVTQLHADIGWLLAGLTMSLAVGLRFGHAPALAARLGLLLPALLAAQGAIGYAQYFTGLPAGLVWVHVSLAVIIWITALRLWFALRDRGLIAAAAPSAQSLSQNVPVQ